MAYTLTQTSLGASSVQLDVLWSVNAQHYILQSDLMFKQLLQTIFDVADYLAVNSTPDYRLLRPFPATDSGATTNNIGIGTNANSSVASGNNNLAVGVSALAANTSGANNTAIGLNAMRQLQTPSGCIAIGVTAMTGAGSFAIGGTSNICVGNNALGNIDAANNNVAIGVNSGNVINLGSQNTFLGGNTNCTGANTNFNVAIGYGATAPNLSGTLSVGGSGANAMANLTSVSAGGSAGLHLIIYLNGTPYKIQLLNS
jgi:hypothetical protein